jgi:hypothetical protein
MASSTTTARRHLGKPAAALGDEAILALADDGGEIDASIAHHLDGLGIHHERIADPDAPHTARRDF